jgi:hypothetical protein
MDQPANQQSDEAEALFESGKRLYLPGPGRRPDPELALAHLGRAARLGHRGARRLLGVMRLEGSVVERDLGEALHWLELASAQGDPMASYHLALMRAQGLGVDKDWSAAHELLSRPGVSSLPEARELRRRLSQELIALYPNLAAALRREEAVYRAGLTRAQSRFILPFLDHARDGGDRGEFEIWLSLSLGRRSAEAALPLLMERLADYYRLQRGAHPAAAGPTPCP